ncbi:glycosyl transferase family 2 [Isoptericola jiangsuensis]|uniref:Glycosyl transferase family 2 n=1 Tax=Isoptericola jiangsuensis TaxID=548579 RepID=A0A2A9EZ66_9MICO|nr:glycosyltransferase family A protein [Isoptericola jiangsuensis]PFG44334.1 glycosyl transferase family 2 [Isoptericola jiangsuensis]
MGELIDRDDDYGRWILNDSTFRQREINRLKSHIRDSEDQARQRSSHSAHGVSVIIPTYRGRDRIVGTLDSVHAQALDPELFEVIVVANGEPDGTLEIVRELAAGTSVPTRLIHARQPSAGAARNLGIAAARKSYVTFVDDDDRIERNYLSALLEQAGLGRVVVAPIKDLPPEGEPQVDSVLASRLRELVSRSGATPIEQVTWLLGFNACKLIPTSIARMATYATDLRSGEDVAYMASLLGRDLVVVGARDADDENAYLRTLRGESVSRREMTFDFAVRDRLAVIRNLPEPLNAKAASAQRHLLLAQANFIRRYLDENPEQVERVAAEIDKLEIADFPWALVNRGRARDLAILYCFAPFLDSSGVVAAKALAERDRVVDVISADMADVRGRDDAVDVLASRWIDRRQIVPGRASFGDWKAISDFATKAAAQAEVWHAERGGYETLYTRALWVGSHVAGALFKQSHWNVRWTAEFSDPLGRGVDGSRRPGTLSHNGVTERLRRVLDLHGVQSPEDATLFEFIELVTYVLADELIFTNANQRDYMLSLVDPKVAALAREKSVVRAHPTPIQAAYTAKETRYQVPESAVNIAYFGSFYGNRTLDEVLFGIVNLQPKVRAQVRVHIFCNKPVEFREEVRRYGLGGNVIVNSYLSYMEFLNASTKFDALIVKDVDSAGDFERNPFLPSKYSDYRGSGASVWGIVEDSSPLSECELDYVSRVGDGNGARAVIEAIVRDRDEARSGRVTGV